MTQGKVNLNDGVHELLQQAAEKYVSDEEVNEIVRRARNGGYDYTDAQDERVVRSIDRYVRKRLASERIAKVTIDDLLETAPTEWLEEILDERKQEAQKPQESQPRSDAYPDLGTCGCAGCNSNF